MTDKEVKISDLDKILTTEGLEGDASIKLTALFETSLSEAITEKTAELETIAEAYVTEAIAEKTAELEDKLDKYLSYVAEEFISENEIALESGRKVAAAEAILEGVTTLMEEQQLSIDESSIDEVAEIQTTVDSITVELDESIDAQIALKSEITSLKREIVMNECSTGLSDVQSERHAILMEDFDFDASDVSSFIGKSDAIKSTLTAPTAEIVVEAVEVEEPVMVEESVEAPVMDDFMASIVSHLGRK
jgi:hypothetical protein